MGRMSRSALALAGVVTCLLASTWWPAPRSVLAGPPHAQALERGAGAAPPTHAPRRRLAKAPAAPTPTATPTVPRVPLVVSCYPLAEDAGYRTLAAGGNAVDAFVAVTAVENVLGPGLVTFSGLLSALVFDAPSRTVLSLDAGNNTVLDPSGAFDPEHPVVGKLVAVPGVVAGLDAMRTRFGKLEWAQDLAPAIALARDGFVVDEAYAYQVAANAESLRSTDYGRRTFFPNGRALRAGDRLRQPELAAFLEGVGREGASYMYTGQWALDCVEAVRQAGGLMTPEDLATYHATWTEPWRIDYRGYEVLATSGKIMHGLWTLLALQTVEHAALAPLGHFTVSADALEIMVRTTRAVDEEAWIGSCSTLDDLPLVRSRLTDEYADGIWRRVQAAKTTRTPPERPGQHTLCSVTVDSEGNVVSGKHSVSSSWLWGIGRFVQGVALNATAESTERNCGPGARRTQGAPNLIALRDGAVRVACGVTGGSGPQTAFQLLVNALDYGLPADDAAMLPRFGQYVWDPDTGQIDTSRNEIGSGFSSEVVVALARRGILFETRAKVGNGCIAILSSSGESHGRWTR